MKTLCLVLLLCFAAATPAHAADPADSGVPSIEDLQKQLDQKKAAKAPAKSRHGSKEAPTAQPAAAPQREQEPPAASARKEAADDKIRVSSTVPLARGEDGIFEVGPTCNWTSVLVAKLVHDSRGRVQTTDKDLDRVGGRTLKLTVLGIHTSGGGAFSGRKWARLRGELRVDGQVTYRFQMTKSSSTDLFRFSACSVANKLANALGESTAEWLRHPANLSEAAGDAPPATAKDDKD